MPHLPPTPTRKPTKRVSSVPQHRDSTRGLHNRLADFGAAPQQTGFTPTNLLDFDGPVHDHVLAGLSFEPLTPAGAAICVAKSDKLPESSVIGDAVEIESLELKANEVNAHALEVMFDDLEVGDLLSEEWVDELESDLQALQLPSNKLPGADASPVIPNERS